MTKSNITVKNISTITIDERVNVINTIVNSYFQTNDDGEIEYTPYFSEVGKVIAISKYLIEGVSFNKDESIYSAVINDHETKTLVNNVISTNKFKSIMNTVHDIVEFKKAEIIAHIQNEVDSVVSCKILELVEKETEKTELETETLNNFNIWIDEQRELNALITPEMQRNFAENFNPDSLADSVIKKYSESDIYKRNKELLDVTHQLKEKDNKIIELENKLKSK